MKYILFLLLISQTCFAQVEVKSSPKKTTIGKIKKTGTELSLYVDADNDSSFLLIYNNAAYQHITDFQSVRFTSEGGAFEAFYKILKSVFENEKNKDYSVDFKLGTQDVNVSNSRVMGISRALLMTPRGHVFFTEKEVDTLFGK